MPSGCPREVWDLKSNDKEQKERQKRIRTKKEARIEKYIHQHRKRKKENKKSDIYCSQGERI